MKFGKNEGQEKGMIDDGVIQLLQSLGDLAPVYF